jgi:hypothetical protein
MHVTALISVAIAAVGAMTVAIWMPGRAAARPVGEVPLAEPTQATGPAAARAAETIPARGVADA